MLYLDEKEGDMPLPTETLKSMLPQDIPWWETDYAVFFGVLYLVLIALSVGILYVIIKTRKDIHTE